MKKWVCGILLLMLVVVCAFALAEEAPAMSFVEEERINYKPILTGNREELTVDTWLQKMAVNVTDEDLFWSMDPDGPVYSFEQIDGPATEAHIDGGNVLRLDSLQNKVCKITFKLTAEWAGVTAETNMYIKFYKCPMPKTIGFEDEYTLYAGETIKLDTNYDNGKWNYPKNCKNVWLGLYPQESSNDEVIQAWPEEHTHSASTYIRGLKAGKATLLLEANQNGLNWYKTIEITVVDYTDAQGNKYFLNSDKTAKLTKGKKNISSAVIPNTIEVGKQKYKVTEIGKAAFSGNKKLKSLTIGKNVVQIGSKAFYNCKKLESITVKTSKLAGDSIGANAFKNIYKKAVFKCPSKKLAKTYKQLLINAGAPKEITCK